MNLGAQVIHYFRDIFHNLQSRCNLDPLNELQLFVLRFVFLPRRNRMLAEFVTAGKHDWLRATKNQSPLQI